MSHPNRQGNPPSGADKVSDAAAEAVSGLSAAVSSARENFGEVAEQLTDLASQATQQVRDHWDEGVALMQEKKEELEKTVRARPLTALALAAGLGLLLGLMWRRR